MEPPTLKEATAEELCERLANGESLVAICRDANMPSVRSVTVWMADDPEFAAQVTRAREAGYLIRGERAVEAAKAADDAALGRLAFDAERWYLGKLSNAFRDKVTLSGDQENPVKVEHGGDGFDKLAAILDAAATARAGGIGGAEPVDGDGTTGAADTAG